MKTNKTTTLIIIIAVATVFTLGGVAEKADACSRRGGCPGTTHTNTPSIVAPHFYQPVVPPGFPQKWLYRDVVQSFIENGLAVKEINEVTETENKYLPADAKEAAKFSIHSSKGKAEGCILCFEDKDDLEKVTEHYRKLNENGELYSWTFVKDNVLLVITGPVSEEEARQYEKVLYELKEEK